MTADGMSMRDQHVVVAKASEGIGLAVARLAVQAGARVRIGSRDAGRLDAARAVLEADGGRAETAVLDGCDEAPVRGFFDGVARIDHLAILAGGPVIPKPFLDQSLADLEAAVRGKLFALWTIARHGVPSIR